MDLPWSLITVISSVALAWSGLLLGAIRWLINAHQRNMEHRFQQLELVTKQKTQHLHDLDRDILRLRAELPNEYVRREDWIRFGGQIDSKLDALYQRIDKLRDEVKNG